jgi:uncharacterized membrane protein YkoI
MSKIRTNLITAAAVCSAAIGGGAIANAATSTTTTPATGSAPATNQQGAPQSPHTLNGKTEQPLTGDVAAKVKAAALAKVSGTVERVETNVDSSAPYEAHITKADGSEVTVEVNSDYSVASVNAMPSHP